MAVAIFALSCVGTVLCLLGFAEGKDGDMPRSVSLAFAIYGALQTAYFAPLALPALKRWIWGE